MLFQSSNSLDVLTNSVSPAESVGDGDVVSGWIWVVNWLGDKISAFWLFLLFVPVSLDMSWEVTVSSVIEVLGWEEVVWLVEFVQLVMGVFEVILDTITIFIVDFLSVGVLGGFPFFIVETLDFSLDGHQVLWTFDDIVKLMEISLVGLGSRHSNESTNSE